MKSTNFKFNRLLVSLVDAISIALAHLLAYAFRFEFIISSKQIDNMLWGILILVPFKIMVFYWFGLYRGMWRFTGLNDLTRLLRANALSSLIVFNALMLLYGFKNISRSIFIMDGVLCFLFTTGFRLTIRIYFTHRNNGLKLNIKKLFSINNNIQSGKKTLLIGAGFAGEALIREIFQNPFLNIMPIGFLDDDKLKKGLSLHGVPVLGDMTLMNDVIANYDVEQIILTIPSASADQIRQIVNICKGTGLPYKTLPSIGKLIDGSVSIKELRDVNYEDLLGRPPVELNDFSISRYIKGKTVFITGGGGSIGSELCRQVIKYNPSHLIVLDSSEVNLFNIDAELRNNTYGVKVASLLGRVQNKIFLEDIFQKYKPQIVFHAAAYKHVPLIERFPWEGVHNNVIASKLLMECAVENKVERFVLVSTDKAVRPTNVMGASKRLTELLARSMNGNGTKFMAVRFGNVVGSSGSVVPFFRKQIRDGGPVTVTHTEATRYFMTIPEASKLILQAGAIGEGGEIFLLKMGTPVRIMQMAEDLIRLSGKEPYEEIDIVVIGLREGEKIYEELITDDEGVINTEHDKIMVLGPTTKGFTCRERDSLRDMLDAAIPKLERAAESCESEAIRLILKKLIPEYVIRKDSKLTSQTIK